ncbi:jg27266 [Pararge aegeria aegeria]|uniref:Jg27266 protein n=1 Tax=Pararge aegeria aegeria TaxID=348720 RepID=A0A8S4RI40_9NEOP|nr:jg27266 [Pararge aegeria aegeria]
MGHIPLAGSPPNDPPRSDRARLERDPNVQAVWTCKPIEDLKKKMRSLAGGYRREKFREKQSRITGSGKKTNYLWFIILITLYYV